MFCFPTTQEVIGLYHSYTFRMLAATWFCQSTKEGGGALGYFLGGYVAPGTPNWHPVLEKIFAKIARSKSGASKSRPLWAAHTRIGNVWECPPRRVLAVLEREHQSTRSHDLHCVGKRTSMHIRNQEIF